MNDEFETTVEIVRGGDANHREKFRTKVSAESIETLNEKVLKVREHAEQWAEEFHQIQPDRGRSLADDQGTLTEVGES